MRVIYSRRAAAILSAYRKRIRIYGRPRSKKSLPYTLSLSRGLYLYKGLMLKCTQDKLLKMFIIAVVIINYT